MKTNIRNGVWETNSSMTHSIVILPEDKYNEWKDGLYLYTGDAYWNYNKLAEKDKPEIDHLYTIDKVKKYISDSSDEEVDFFEFSDEDYAEGGFYSFEEWPRYFENSATHYTTEGGEKLVIRSYYGHDW